MQLRGSQDACYSPIHSIANPATLTASLSTAIHRSVVRGVRAPQPAAVGRVRHLFDGAWRDEWRVVLRFSTRLLAYCV